MIAEPRAKGVDADPGGDGNDELLATERGSQLSRDLLHDLRLDREHDHGGADCGVPIVGGNAHRPAGVAGALLGDRVADHDGSVGVCRRNAAGKRERHVAAADESHGARGGALVHSASCQLKARTIAGPQRPEAGKGRRAGTRPMRTGIRGPFMLLMLDR